MLANEGTIPVDETCEGSLMEPSIIHGAPSSAYVTEFHTGAHCHGAGTDHSNLSVKQIAAVERFVRDNFPDHISSFHLQSVREHKSATLKGEFKSVKIESSAAFRERSVGTRSSRQKYCIAAHFVQEDQNNSSIGSDEEGLKRVEQMYYGIVRRIMEIMLDLGSKKVAAVFVDIQ